MNVCIVDLLYYFISLVLHFITAIQYSKSCIMQCMEILIQK